MTTRRISTAPSPFASLLFGVAALILVDATGARAQGFAEASGDVDARLERALDELGALRDQIAEKKIPLSKSISALEDEVIGLRRENERLYKARDNSELSLTKLKSQVEALEDQDDFIDARLNEFARNFEGRLHISELARYEDRINAAKLAEKDAKLDTEGKRATQLAVVDDALDRVHALLGGYVFDGKALSPDGMLTEGRFVAMGPSVYYASRDGRIAGIAEAQLNAADPVVALLPGGLGRGISTLAETGAGPLPFDGTLGKALKKERAQKSLAEYIRDGGMVGYIILALGLAAALITLLKLFEILAFQTATPDDVDAILTGIQRGDLAAATRAAHQLKGAAGEMLAVGVQHVRQARGVLEELLFEKILKVRPTLERFLPFLAITAGAAPLLGLLGTVSGMIKTFQLITVFGTGDARNLSSGISEALVTTAMGLIVAIPALILHGALSRLAKRKLSLLEQASVAFVSGVESIREEAGEQSLGG